MLPQLERIVVVAIVVVSSACGERAAPQPGATPGAERTAKTAALETGASLIQAKPPLQKLSMHLNGFHPAKDDPSMQMESHHYCNQVNEDFAQCVLFDGDDDAARMHGIEFIISEKLYGTLAVEERAYWHPHNYEILSGQLRMPGLVDVVEEEALETKMNSYGKTWHVWKTGVHGRPNDALPLGPAHLAWSFNYDGEAAPELVAARDRRLKFDTGAARESRANLRALARPQGGVDALKGRFPHATTTVEGVADNGDTSARRMPLHQQR